MSFPNLVGVEVGLWLTAGAATLFTIGSFVIRFKVRGSFYWDDYARLLAWVSMIAMSAAIQAIFPSAGRVLSPSGPPDEASFVEFRKLQIVLTILSMFALWFVKYAFLLFYRLLFWVSPTFRKLWWATAVILFITFWVPIAGTLTYCGPAWQSYNPVACQSTEYLQQDVLIYFCTVSVFTDLLVMALPWYMIPKIKMRTSRKLGLALVFSLAFLTIALDILRTYESYVGAIFANSAVYTYLEIQFALIASCLPTYRAIFGMKRRTKGPEYTTDQDISDPSTNNNESHSPLNPSFTESEPGRSLGHQSSFAKYGAGVLDLPSSPELAKSRHTEDVEGLELRQMPQAHILHANEVM